MSNGSNSSNNSNSNTLSGNAWVNSTSGNVVIGSSSNSTAIGNNGWYVSPSTTTGTTVIGSGGYSYGSGTISIGGSTTIKYNTDRYYIMKMPDEVKKKMPESIYVNGMLATLGMFGSDVDVAFTGQDLIFQSGVLRALVIGEKIKISVYFKKRIYHFKCLPNAFGAGVATISENSNVIDSELLSTIER